LYESWSIPFAVMLVVPLGIFGSVLAVELRGLTNDVYFKVGLIAIIGLSAKNAILIIEFARELQEQGMELMEATLEACRLRIRAHRHDLDRLHLRRHAPGAFPPAPAPTAATPSAPA
jgi:multidrug efflux pump